jgi:hypothetical protein
MPISVARTPHKSLRLISGSVGISVLASKQGNIEIGAAWQRTSKDNTVYHSVKLDDPSFAAPIYANLVAVALIRAVTAQYPTTLYPMYRWISSE